MARKKRKKQYFTIDLIVGIVFIAFMTVYNDSLFQIYPMYKVIICLAIILFGIAVICDIIGNGFQRLLLGISVVLLIISSFYYNFFVHQIDVQIYDDSIIDSVQGVPWGNDFVENDGDINFYGGVDQYWEYYPCAYCEENIYLDLGYYDKLNDQMYIIIKASMTNTGEQTLSVSSIKINVLDYKPAVAQHFGALYSGGWGDIPGDIPTDHIFQGNISDRTSTVKLQYSGDDVLVDNDVDTSKYETEYNTNINISGNDMGDFSLILKYSKSGLYTINYEIDYILGNEKKTYKSNTRTWYLSSAKEKAEINASEYPYIIDYYDDTRKNTYGNTAQMPV